MAILLSNAFGGLDSGPLALLVRRNLHFSRLSNHYEQRD